ncbi:MAG: hypothetical protein K2X08_04020 [Chlamydiales bacterium]|nr:hypothetical protein [Chlamydiales bacterium]MBY0529896.1 hypothetical protein [Rhabdochlamydiaceae bacterium]
MCPESEVLDRDQLNGNVMGSLGEKAKALLFLVDKFAVHREAVIKIIIKKTEGIWKMDKSKALCFLLEKLAEQREVIVQSLLKRVDSVAKINLTRVLPLALFVCGMLMHSQGYCDAKATEGLDSITTNVMGIIFGSTVRKSLLAIAAAWGVFQAVTSGSFKPVLFWGGIGLAIAYVPRLVEIISSVG